MMKKRLFEKMKETDYNLCEDMIIAIPNKETINQSSEISELYIGRTHNSIILGKIFKTGQINASKVFCTGSTTINREDNFLNFNEISSKSKKIFPDINPKYFKILPYPYPSNWISYVLKNKDNEVFIFVDFPKQPLMIVF